MKKYCVSHRTIQLAYYLSILLTYFTLSVGAAANSTNIDSLKKIVSFSQNDSIRMSVAYAISYNVCHTNPDSGIFYGHLASQFAEKADSDLGRASALSQIGYSYYKKDIIDSALLYWNESANQYVELDQLYKAALIWENIGIQHIFLGKYEKAELLLDSARNVYESLDSTDIIEKMWTNYGLLFDVKGDYKTGFEYYHKAFKLAEAKNDKYRMGLALSNICAMYYYVEKCEESIEYGRRTLTFWKEDKYLENRANTVKNMGVCFEELGLIDSALYYYDLSLGYDEQLGDEMGKAKAYNNMGALYASQGNTDLGLTYLLKALEIKKKFGLREGVSATYLLIGELYSDLNEHSKAFYYLNEGKNVATELRSLEDLKDAEAYLAEHYESIGATSDALMSWKRYVQLNDSLLNSEIRETIDNLEIKYQTEKKELQNLQLRHEQHKSEITMQNQRKGLIFAGSAILAITLFTFLLRHQLRKRNQANKLLDSQHEKIKTLNKELNHRVKNNLSFMTGLLEMQGRRTDSEETKQALKESESRLHALGLIHNNLFKNQNDTAVNLKDYLSEICHHLQDVYEIPDKELFIQTEFADINMDAEDAMRIGLIVNELVTNSVKHAFIEVAEPTISIETKKADDGLIKLRYRDNGPGMTKLTDAEEFQSVDTLGKKLIQLLGEQLKDRVILDLA